MDPFLRSLKMLLNKSRATCSLPLMGLVASHLVARETIKLLSTLNMRILPFSRVRPTLMLSLSFLKLTQLRTSLIFPSSKFKTSSAKIRPFWLCSRTSLVRTQPSSMICLKKLPRNTKAWCYLCGLTQLTSGCISLESDSQSSCMLSSVTLPNQILSS